MKIILIAGTWYTPGAYGPIWGNIKDAFWERVPHAEFAREYAEFRLGDIEKMRSLGEKIIAQHDTGGEVLLVGHSMGGIIACGIAPKFKNTKVRGIVTIFSPHVLGGFIPQLDYYRKIYGEEPSLNAPVVSFGGWLDVVVPLVFTPHPRAARHVNLLSDHRFILGFNRDVGRTIAEEVDDIFAL